MIVNYAQRHHWFVRAFFGIVIRDEKVQYEGDDVAGFWFIGPGVFGHSNSGVFVDVAYVDEI